MFHPPIESTERPIGQLFNCLSAQDILQYSCAGSRSQPPNWRLTVCVIFYFLLRITERLWSLHGCAAIRLRAIGWENCFTPALHQIPHFWFFWVHFTTRWHMGKFSFPGRKCSQIEFVFFSHFAILEYFWSVADARNPVSRQQIFRSQQRRSECESKIEFL